MSTVTPAFVKITPFGPYCSSCNLTLSLEKGIAKHAKEVHPDSVFQNATVVRALKGEMNRLRKLHFHDFSPFLCTGSKSSDLWFCTVCFVAFSKNSNFTRHLGGRASASCTVDSGLKIECYETICGRKAPKSLLQSTTTLTPTMVSNYSTVSSLTTNHNVSDGFGASSTTVPVALMTTQEEAIAFLSPYVRQDEDAHDLAMIYYPLLGPTFEATIKQYLEFSSSMNPEEPILLKWIEVGKLWLCEYAAGHIANVSANVRHRLAEFEQKEVDGITVGSNTFTLRRGIPRLLSELDSALRFFFRFPSTLFDEFKGDDVLLSTPKSLIETAMIPRILYLAAKEEPEDHGHIPIACRYCLSRGFTSKSGNQLTMNECGWFSSRISAMMHLLRAGVCGYLVTLKVDQSNNDLTIVEMELVKAVQHGRVTNLLAPYVKRLRDLNSRKPPIKNNTVNCNGDITSGAFTFPKSIWSTLIPRLVRISRNCFAEIFEGNMWEYFLRYPVSVADWILLDVSTQAEEKQFFLRDLKVKDHIQPVLAKLQSVAELCLFGLGVGAVRHEEVTRLKVTSCQWHNSYLYFWTESLKKGSMKARGRPKLIEHRLSLSLSKIFLLIRQAFLGSNNQQSNDLIPDFPDGSMIPLVRDLFDFDYKPMLLNVRHLFTSIGNILFPHTDGKENPFVSSTLLTEKSGHTQATGKRSYGTWMANGEESLYDFYHKELGEELLEAPKVDFTPFSHAVLTKSLKKLLGAKAMFRSFQQKEMITFAANSVKRHSFISLPCGQGKSMSWLVPILASFITGRHVGLRIVILPYKFLLGHMVEQAKSFFSQMLHQVQVESADSSAINNDSIPSWMEENDLPSLLFLNLDAAEKLLCYHMERLQRWALNNLLKRIYFDEFQQIIIEYGFRQSYQNLRKLGRVGVPVMCLSGSLPTPVALTLMEYCCLTKNDSQTSIDTVECVDPIGDGFDFDVEIVENIAESVVDFISNKSDHACHVICATKELCFAIEAGLTMNFKVLTVTGDTSSAEQSNCAKAWLTGSHDVLVSTVVALVGNENRHCKTIVIAGFLYNISNLVQAIGRLRPEQRGLDACVQVFRLPFHTRDRDDAKTSAFNGFNVMSSEDCFPTLSRKDYFLLFSPWGLHKFFKKKDGCYLQELSLHFGFHRPRCNRCGNCRKEANDRCLSVVGGKNIDDDSNLMKRNLNDDPSIHTLRKYPRKSLVEVEPNGVAIAKSVSENISEQERSIRRMADCVFLELSYKCIGCNRADCVGECAKGCFRCGDLRHFTNACNYNHTRLSSILLNKGVCFGCFDTRQRGIELHNIQQCPLKRRLKRLLFIDREKKPGNFEDYLRLLYANELSFLRMVASFADRVTLGSVLYESRRQKHILSCTQISHDDSNAPLLPPDLTFMSKDNSVDGTPRTTRYTTIAQARNEYQRLRRGSSSVLRHRKFVFGALYENLFQGYHLLDPLVGDYDLAVTLPSNEQSTLRIRLISPDEGVGSQRVLSSILQLCRGLKGSGNARGAKVGDVGQMHALGVRAAATKEIFKPTLDHAERVTAASRLFRNWMEDNLREELSQMLKVDKGLGVSDLLSCLSNGPGCRLMISVNLGNSAHLDINDSSLSVAVWIEEKPGQSSNWFFVLPNMSYQKSNGVVVKLHHGVVISWDGQSIYHCTSKTNVGVDNRTYGCMWGSCPA